MARNTDTAPTALEAATARSSAQTGDFSASEAWVASNADDTRPFARAWTAALNAQRWHAQPADCTLPTLEDLRAIPIDSEEAVGNALVFAAAECLKGAVVGGDPEALGTWVAFVAELDAEPLGAEATAWAAVGNAWLQVAEGSAEQAESLVDAIQNQSIEEHAALRVEVLAIRALCMETRGEVEAMTGLARQAWRDARTNDLPQWQYLAGVVLARARRLNGTHHLATRILRPLSEVAPAGWQGWIVWESLMAGAVTLTEGLTLHRDADPTDASGALQSLVIAARDGDHDAFQSARTRLSARSRTPGSARWREGGAQGSPSLSTSNASPPRRSSPPRGSPRPRSASSSATAAPSRRAPSRSSSRTRGCS